MLALTDDPHTGPNSPLFSHTSNANVAEAPPPKPLTAPSITAPPT